MRPRCRMAGQTHEVLVRAGDAITWRVSCRIVARVPTPARISSTCTSRPRSRLERFLLETEPYPPRDRSIRRATVWAKRYSKWAAVVGCRMPPLPAPGRCAECQWHACSCAALQPRRGLMRGLTGQPRRGVSAWGLYQNQVPRSTDRRDLFSRPGVPVPLGDARRCAPHHGRGCPPRRTSMLPRSASGGPATTSTPMAWMSVARGCTAATVLDCRAPVRQPRTLR